MPPTAKELAEQDKKNLIDYCVIVMFLPAMLLTRGDTVAKWRYQVVGFLQLLWTPVAMTLMLILWILNEGKRMFTGKDLDGQTPSF